MKKITLVDLFCGAGIGALGFKEAGFELIWANDNNKFAVSTYNKMIGNHAICKDIREIDLNEIPDSCLISAGFPCQPFSFGGNGEGENCKTKGDLGKVFLDIVVKKQPPVFFFENVSGLTSKKHKTFFENLIKEFETGGYNVSWDLIDCFDYGVPQKRKRVFAVGYRKDLNKIFKFPEKSDIKLNIRDAIGDLPEPSIYPNSLEKIKNHYGFGIRNDEIPFVDKIPIGGNWRSLDIEDQKKFLGGAFNSGGGRTGFLRKINFDNPAHTITSIMDGKNNAQILDNHDKYKTNKLANNIPNSRRFTVRECLRLQTVPDSFYFEDSIPLRKQYERCSGIPTLIAYKLSKIIYKDLQEVLNGKI